jgi:hypothetical protein
VEISRRKLIGVSTGAVLSVAGLALFLSDSVMAASLTIDDDSITTDKGQLTGLTVTLNSTFDYDGAETNPGETKFKVKTRVKDSGNSYNTLTEKEVDVQGTSGTKNVSFNSVDILDELDAEVFDANTDGGQTVTDIQLKLTITTENDVDGDGNSEDEVSDSTTTTITLNNQEFSGDSSGSGSVSASGE